MTNPAANWAKLGPAPMDIPLKAAITRASSGLSPASVLQALVDWQVHLMVSPSRQLELAARGGANHANGFANWLCDALAVLADGKPRGVEAFRPGSTVAVTPGKVVMRNHLMEPIQYEPTTPRVYAEPVLIIGSWIMKYYILDLTPGDSLVRYLMAQGHTVFIASWRNPGSVGAGLGMDDYLELGVMESMRAVQRLCEYLRTLYLNNDLAEHRYRVHGHHVALHDIRTPMFVVATERDHVSPWRSVYRIHRLVDAPVTFVLASGGHNVGIVSPPGPAANPGAAYRFSHHDVHDAPLDPQEWFGSVPPVAGSWWPFWHRWLRDRSGKRVPARRVAGLVEGGKPVAAPGTYVFQE